MFSRNTENGFHLFSIFQHFFWWTLWTLVRNWYELIWQDFWFHKKKLWLFKNLIYIYYSFKIRLLSRKDQRANQNIPKWNALIWLVKWSLVLPDLEFVKLPKHLWNDQIGRFFGQRCSIHQSAVLRWSQLKWSSEVWLT